MKASIVDLRYKMNDIIKALERNEQVTILYRGKEKGTIIPKKTTLKLKVTDHPFFGMLSSEKDTVEEKIEFLRGPRYNDFCYRYIYMGTMRIFKP